jgi:hypothetical protein
MYSTWPAQIPREENRRQEILELIAEGKIPHGVEIEKHPEKSMQGRMCGFSHDSDMTRIAIRNSSLYAGLMGQVAASIKVILRLFVPASKISC